MFQSNEELSEATINALNHQCHTHFREANSKVPATGRSSSVQIHLRSSHG
jgi:hypothetical protein